MKEYNNLQKKELENLDKKIVFYSKKFDAEPLGTERKGELLRCFVELQEQRCRITNNRGDKAGVKLLRKLYNTGFKKGKWKKPKN